MKKLCNKRNLLQQFLLTLPVLKNWLVCSARIEPASRVLRIHSSIRLSYEQQSDRLFWSFAAYAGSSESFQAEIKAELLGLGTI